MKVDHLSSHFGRTESHVDWTIDILWNIFPVLVFAHHPSSTFYFVIWTPLLWWGWFIGIPKILKCIFLEVRGLTSAGFNHLLLLPLYHWWHVPCSEVNTNIFWNRWRERKRNKHNIHMNRVRWSDHMTHICKYKNFRLPTRFPSVS